MGRRRPAVRVLSRPSAPDRTRTVWRSILHPDGHRAAAAGHACSDFQIASSPGALKRATKKGMENTMSQPILVTGAAGGAQGSTGRLVAESLLERGLAVRALV